MALHYESDSVGGVVQSAPNHITPNTQMHN